MNKKALEIAFGYALLGAVIAIITIASVALMWVFSPWIAIAVSMIFLVTFGVAYRELSKNPFKK